MWKTTQEIDYYSSSGGTITTGYSSKTEPSYYKLQSNRLIQIHPLPTVYEPSVPQSFTIPYQYRPSLPSMDQRNKIRRSAGFGKCTDANIADIPTLSSTIDFINLSAPVHTTQKLSTCSNYGKYGKRRMRLLVDRRLNYYTNRTSDYGGGARTSRYSDCCYCFYCCNFPYYRFSCRDIFANIDTDYLNGTEALLKLIEICLCTLTALVGAHVRGVRGERGFTLAAAIFALFATVSILICKLGTLHRSWTPKHWFVVESSVYTLLSVAFFAACALLSLDCSPFWAEFDPNRKTLPIITASSAFGSAVAFIVDAILVFRHRNVRTWIPFISEYKI